MDGIFGGLFDFNGDGELDFIEQGAELYFLQKLTEEEDEDSGEEE